MKGPKKHLKRLAAPKSWSLKKSEGKYAPRPTPGPHKKDECIPLNLILTKLLNVTKSTKEIQYVLKNQLIKINGVKRTDPKFPVGLFDVITLATLKSTNKHYRLILNTCAKFKLIEIATNGENYRISKVTSKCLRRGNTPFIYTSQGTSHRYCDPEIQVTDTVKINEANEVKGFLHFEVGKEAYLIKGKNAGCIGVIISIEKRANGFSLVKMRDSNGRVFSTTENFCMVIGGGDIESRLLDLEGVDGLKLSELEYSNKRYGLAVQADN
ncbi:40S ribosomal protein S4-A [Cucumispora dikerogammari]|nr:40S ribosomal protein S4-A [Cucumispora dikerogammari]